MATSDIREHMEVLDKNGQHVGTVDHLDGRDRIKLTKSDSPDGQHHFIPIDWVDHVDYRVHLSLEKPQVQAGWQ